MWSYQFRRTTLWLTVFISLLAGLGLARTGIQMSLAWCAVSLMPVLFVMRKRTWLALCLVVCCGVSIGCLRGSVFMVKRAGYQNLSNHKLTLVVQALDDGVYGTHAQMSFDGAARLLDGQTLAGKVKVSGFGVNSVLQGDEILVSGKLRPGQGSYQAQISFAQLTSLKHHSSVVAEVRRRFTAGIQSSLPEPLASFAMGLLIGQRATLPPAIKQDLLMVGLTHIIAVSGYNLTIILRASRKLLAQQSKRLSLLLSYSLIGCFLLMTGSSASIVRAAIVSLLSIVASYYGRSFKPLNLILLAATITAYANPFYLWSDISWYLSFLAFFGVMILAPAIASRLHPRIRESIIAQIALESICAELMTWPIIVHTFGQMSFVGLIANVLVVALIPLGMLLSTIAGLAGMFAGPVAGWISLPARLLLSYMLDVAHILAHIPHIFVQHLGLSLMQMVLLYIMLAMLTTVLVCKNKRKSSTITDKIW